MIAYGIIKGMKKLFLILIMFIFTNCGVSCAADIESDINVNKILSIDIKTLKYEQRQLVYAILTGDEKSVRTILDSDENPKTTYARIPLIMFAIYENNADMIKLLVEYGFNPNETVMDVTPIELAIYMKKYQSIEYLLSIGVTLTEEDFEIIKKSKDKRLKELFK